MTTKHVSEMSDRKFFMILCVLLPSGVTFGGILVGHIFFDSFFSYSWLLLGSVTGLVTLGLGYRGFKDGSNLYKALDKQDDKCLTCGKLINPDDRFYWNGKAIYCINHRPEEVRNE